MSRSKVDEKKVGKTVKMIEQLLKESKQQISTSSPDYDPDSDSQKDHYYEPSQDRTQRKSSSKTNSTSKSSTRSGSNAARDPTSRRSKSRDPNQEPAERQSKSRDANRESTARRSKSRDPNQDPVERQSKSRDANQDPAERQSKSRDANRESTGRRSKSRDPNQEPAERESKSRARSKSKKKASDVSEQEKKRFFDEKKIIVNQGIDDNLEPNDLPKKPKKKNLAAEKSFLREKSKVSLLSVSGKEPERESGSFARNDEGLAQDLATKDDARQQQSGKQAATKQNVSVERQTKIIRENLNPRNDGTNTKKDVGSTFILS